MNHRYRITTFLLTALLATGLLAADFAVPAYAQQSKDRVDLPVFDSPAVTAVLETNPTTTDEWVRVAKILTDLGRPDLGKKFLRKVIDAKLSQQELAELVEEFGSAIFLNMSSREELLPEAKQLADALLAATNEQSRKQIPEFVQGLQDPSSEVRSRAMEGLKRTRAEAVGPMIAVLTDPGRAAEHRNILAALVEMRRDAIGPLLGLLEKSDPRLMAQAIRVLGMMEAKEATYYLLGPCTSEKSDPAIRAAAAAALKRLTGHVPTKREAIRRLTERSKAYFDGTQPIATDAEGRVKLWRWDEGKRQSVGKRYSPEDAALVMAARLARDAYALAEEDPQMRLLYLTTMLEAAAYEAGLDKPLQGGRGTAAQEAARFGTEVIEDALQYAIDGGHVAAATAAARILGQKGEADALLRQGQRPSPLVMATRHPDRRLRLAATEAVVRLQPAGPFPGCSYIPQSLAFFAASGGPRRALVAGPVMEISRELAGMLAAAGYEVDTATTGGELIRLAIASPDYELALIDVTTGQPTVDKLLQQLGRDCRTASLRVGLIARSGHIDRAKHIALREPMAMAFSRPRTEEAIRWQIGRLATLSPRTFVAHGERQHQAAAAMDRLAEISGPNRGVYDVRRLQGSVLAALYNPDLSIKAAAVLGNVNSPESQQALVDLASRWTQPLEIRKAAVHAFGLSIEAHGILLTTDQISRQYVRYNRSQGMDEGTQRLLGLILDYIEAPTQPLQPAKTAEPKENVALGD